MNKIDELMNKMEEVIDTVKAYDILPQKKEVSCKKETNVLVIVFAVIGIVVAVAAAVYGIYRFFTPDYLDDFEDDFDDDFDDDFFEDEEE